MTPAEIEVVRTDTIEYLQRLRAAHFGFAAIASLLVWDILISFDRETHYVWKAKWTYAKVVFLLNRYLAPIVFIVEAILSAVNVSFVLGTRLWALYERSRRVLIALGVGFLGCFVPAWTLTYNPGTNSIDSTELRIFSNVYAYATGVVVQGGPEALNWPLRKCYRFRFPKVSMSILVASFLYESGIFIAMVWTMYKDKKKTRVIEAFYRDGILYFIAMFCNYGAAMGMGFAFDDTVAQGFLTSAFYIGIKSLISAFYIGIKSLMCSYILLRLRSYYDEGDPIIDGHFGTDHAAEGGRVRDHKNSSSRVSTIIQFAHVLSGTSEHIVEMTSRSLEREKHAVPPIGSASVERTIDAGGPNARITPEPTSPYPPISRTRRQRPRLDWIDGATTPQNLRELETPRSRSRAETTRTRPSTEPQRLSLQFFLYRQPSNGAEESFAMVEMDNLDIVHPGQPTRDTSRISRDGKSGGGSDGSRSEVG
ncbi:hypothetical protein FRC04_001130 [Tulasnella sp. 424]|nr:hypothetical protein FRC04_001130 [Tulasnella sp. 424]